MEIQCIHCDEYIDEDKSNWEFCEKHPAKEEIEQLKKKNKILLEALNKISEGRGYYLEGDEYEGIANRALQKHNEQ
jgi:hypothetical protein